MNLNLVYEPSVANAPIGFTATLDRVASFFQSTFTDSVTVNISVGYGQINGQPLSAESAQEPRAPSGFAGRLAQHGNIAETQLAAGALGQSSTFLRSYSYNQIKSALAADAKSGVDQNAVASLSGADPTNGGHYWVTTAEAKALNLGASGGLDGYVGFNSTPGMFDYDNSNGISSGQYDFFSVVAHEISEVMGRQVLVGQTVGSTANSYEVMDLFHYSSANVRDFSGTQPGYFSPDGGATNLNNFNTNPGGDFGDWAGSAGNDAAAAFAHSSVVNTFSTADILVMDTIGWDVIPDAPANAPPPVNSPPPVDTTPVSTNPTRYDFNGDGKSDILWQNDNGQPAIWMMNGLSVSSMAGAGSINPGPTWHIKGSGDFDDDGKSDILWQNDNGQAAIWTMNGATATSMLLAGSINPGVAWHIKGTGDFDGDGKSDILWQNDNGQAAIWMMNGAAATTMALAGSINPGPAWHIRGTGDFDGDGKSDILWQNDSGQAAIWLMSGATAKSMALAGSINPGSTWHIKGAGDFNADGKSDILWQNDSGQAGIWLMNGAAATNMALAGPNPGSAWHVEGAEDLDGNGKSDILWQNDNGQAVAWLMDGTSIVSSSNIGNNPGSAWHIDWA